MKPLEFFRTRATQRVLRRAAMAAAAPVSLHYIEGEQEGLRIVGIGFRAACRWVNGLPEGRKACRQSREEAAVAAAHRKKPDAFICHMGFACVAMPALPDVNAGFVLTFGPYCPAEAPEGLEAAACEALEAYVEDPVQEFPVSLSDIRRTPADTVPAIAEWTSETLSGLWAAMQEGAPTEPPREEARDQGKRVRRRRGKGPEADPYQSAEIAAALAGGNQTQARRLMRAVLSESRAQKRVVLEVQRARAVAAVASALEALERAGADTAPSRQRFADSLAQFHDADTMKQLTDAAMGVLGVVSRKARRRDAVDGKYGPLHDLITARLADGATLKEAAAVIGVNPSAVSHHLQRKYGMSYSQYMGRLRVDKAKELLRRTRLSVSAVARRVGINDVSNFVKLFRKFENRTPLEYREQCRNT